MNRRKLLLHSSVASVWSTPIISSVMLPAHAQTSLGPACITVECASTFPAGTGAIGGLIFDGSNCTILFSNIGEDVLGPVLLNPDRIYFGDNNSAGSSIGIVADGAGTWTVSGLTNGDSVLGSAVDPYTAIGSRSFSITNNSTGEIWSAMLTITRMASIMPSPYIVDYLAQFERCP